MVHDKITQDKKFYFYPEEFVIIAHPGFFSFLEKDFETLNFCSFRFAGRVGVRLIMKFMDDAGMKKIV